MDIINFLFGPISLEDLEIINLFSYTRLWEVDCSDYGSGCTENFWRKKNAIKYAKENIDVYDNVTIRNNITKEKIILKKDERTPILSTETGLIGYL